METESVIGLDSLPVEIIQTVTVLLDAKSALSLSAVSRALHGATNDLTVIKELVDRQQALWEHHQYPNLQDIKNRSSHDAAVLAHYNKEELSMAGSFWKDGDTPASIVLREHLGSSFRQWKRYAVADSSAYAFCNKLDAISSKSRRSGEAYRSLSLDMHLRYLPQLMTLKHPCLNSVGLVPALIAGISSQFADYQEGGKRHADPRLAFCFCASILSQATPDIPEARSPKMRDPMEQFFSDRVRRMLANAERTTSPNDPNMVYFSQYDAQIVIGAFSCLLRRAFRHYRVRRLMGSAYYTFRLPYVLDMPLELEPALSALPLPALSEAEEKHSREGFEGWLRTHVQQMSDPTFLEDGEWVGCYSYYSPEKNADFEAPMEGMAFTVPRRFESGNFVLQSSGSDSVGHFSLNGFCTKAGALRLSKAYQGGHTWEWKCQITPFGITGLWGTADMHQFKCRGTLWLWKRSWTRF